MIRAWAIIRGGEAQVVDVDRQVLVDQLEEWGDDAEIVELVPVVTSGRLRQLQNRLAYCNPGTGKVELDGGEALEIMALLERLRGNQ